VQLIDISGRKKLTVGSFAICGVACLLCALVSPGATRTALAVAGKFGAAIAFIILFLYTTELFPTVVRNAALGSNSSAARVGGMLAPVVVLASKALHSLQLPFVVFGVVSLVAGAGGCRACLHLVACADQCARVAVISSLLPETMNRPLLETFEDVIAEEAQAQAHHRDRPTRSERADSCPGEAALEPPPARVAPEKRHFLSRLRLFQGWAPLDEPRGI